MTRLTSKVPSLVALAVALSGTAYASLALPSASVGTRQLKAKAVTPPKLARSLGAGIAQPGPDGPKGLAGDAGPVGSPGERGAAGADATNGAGGDTGPSDALTFTRGAQAAGAGYAVTFDVPPGSYVVLARLRVKLETSPQPRDTVSCSLLSLTPNQASSATVAVGETATLIISAAGTVTQGGSPAIHCTNPSGGGQKTMTGEGAAVTMLRVANLTG